MLSLNWPAVCVYRLCQWQIAAVAGMGGGQIVWVGIASNEVREVARAMAISCDEDLLWRVKLLASEVAAIRNKR